MTEIDDKELENAAGGAIDIRSGGRECDKYEPKNETYLDSPEDQYCLNCKHYRRESGTDSPACEIKGVSCPAFTYLNSPVTRSKTPSKAVMKSPSELDEQSILFTSLNTAPRSSPGSV